jgi:hypothetical protein
MNLPNIRMESDEKVKLHVKIELGTLSDCAGFFLPKLLHIDANSVMCWWHGT